MDDINPIEHAAAAITIAPHQQRYAIRTTITKVFDDTVYQGTIVLFDEKEGYYKIVYKDNDCKELDKHKVMECLDTPQTQSTPTFTTQDILQLEMSLDIFGPPITIKIEHIPSPQPRLCISKRQGNTHN